MKLRITIFSFFLLCFYPFLSNAQRLEPINIHIQRSNFYKNNFYNFTKNLLFEHSKEKGFYCIANSTLLKNDVILEVPISLTYSIFDQFPLKEYFFNLLKTINSDFENESQAQAQNRINMIKENTINNFLLSTRLLLDLKSNATEMFINFRSYETKNASQYGSYGSLDDFRNYLKSRTSYFYDFIKNLPLTSSLSQFSWDQDEINEYQFTGFLPTIQKDIIKMYATIINKVKTEDEIFYSFIKNWFKEENINLFLSIYGYITSRNFIVRFQDILSNDLNTELNLEIDKNGGNVIIPFLELCNHYHPIKFDKKSDKTVSRVVKMLKISSDSEKKTMKIFSENDYQRNEEFSFSYTKLLSNDYLLLHYGFIIRDNIFQEFVLKFDIEDPKFSFFNFLKEEGFEMNLIHKKQDTFHLTIQFFLRRNELSSQLMKFIRNYIIYNKGLENPKNVKKHTYQKLLKTISKDKLLDLKNNLLYYYTIEKNILLALDGLEGSEKTIMKFFHHLEDYVSKVERLKAIIEKNTEEFNQNKSLEERYKDDDLQNLFYFKQLHSFSKKKLIWQFNLENLKILYSHQKMAINNSIRILKYNMDDLKKNYI
jgi:hypothetical protein